MKKLPIGIQDFCTVREEGDYYVDKSMLISDVLDSNPTGVYLFTRPRRFGKSMNLSMLDCFFNRSYVGNTWFDGLEISNHPEYNEHKNAYPVIYIDFRKLWNDAAKDVLASAKYCMSDLYSKFDFLSDSDKLKVLEKEDFEAIHRRKGDAIQIVNALSDLAKYLHEHFGKKVIVLIDEYDNPMNDTYGTEYADDMRDMVKGLLSSLLKGNTHVKLAVITGVMQIAKESLFSGLNNLKVNNVLSDESDEAFGFTDEEVKGICGYFGHPEKYVEAKEWYDGYRFGNADIYNPWSILNYIEKGFKLDKYWVDTGSNNVMNDILDSNGAVVRKDLLSILDGRPVEEKIDPAVAYTDLNKSKSSLYSIMVMSGYLKAVPLENGKYDISIPNKELLSVIADEVLSRMGDVSKNATAFIKALLDGKSEDVEKRLSDLLKESVSCRLLSSENSYHMFLLGLLVSSSGECKVTGDFESGTGFHDIRIECKNRGHSAVIELKTSRKADVDLDALSRKALEQIHDREYYHGLKGKVLLYGVAIHGKEVHVASEALLL